MNLANYRKKRTSKSPEPRGKKIKSKSSHLYVIQKHAASHLHYDFRLEMQGVLKSWAVPKGPCLDPNIKRLAVHVEDHPVEYGSFEGVIPKGEYGGGNVLLWDTGQWEPLDNPAEAYKKGQFKFILKGQKLKGEWHLVRIHNTPKNWLLIKGNDEYAQSLQHFDILTEEPRSVVTNRLINDISAPRKIKNVQSKNHLEKYALKKTKIPTKINPELATLTKEIPDDDTWLHEIKFDGYRLICFIKNNKIKLFTRHQQDWSNQFPTIIATLKAFNLSNAILDGEIVAIAENNRFDFQLLQNTVNKKTKTPLVYYVFDLIYYNNFNLSNMPLLERKKILKQLLISADSKSLVQYSEFTIGNGKKIFKKACQLQLEGIISKQINSPYVQRRSLDWLKIKCLQRQEFVVCGYTLPTGKRKYFGALLLGIYTDAGQLQYCGAVGTGFTEASLQLIYDKLKKHKTIQMPFSKKPPVNKTIYWLKPILIVEVAFSQWTKGNILRHPSFKGMREDKCPHEIKLEKPQKKRKKMIPMKNNFSFHLTNPYQVLYPDSGLTKYDLAEFYYTIKDWILPYVVNRPLTLLRCPKGYEDCFFQKHLEKTDAKPLYGVEIKGNKKTKISIYIKDVQGLLALVQHGVLEIHPWGSQIDKLDKPDIITFDLDPAPDVEWSSVVKAAHFIKIQLEQVNLQSFVKTSGGKGLHIVIPIKRIWQWPHITQFAQSFADYIVKQNPKQYISTMSKTKRSGKIFIDYLRNYQGATTVAAYSTRAKPHAPISTPLSWDELTPKIQANTYTIQNLLKRLVKIKKDPWEDFFKLKQSLPKF